VPDKDNEDIMAGDSAHDEIITGLEPGPREIIAQAIHEAYRRTWQDEADNDDLATAPWDKLPDYLQESNRRQADHIFEKLRRIGSTVHKVKYRDVIKTIFTKDEIEIMAEMEHARWRNERLRGGWRRGEVKDATNKVSPYLVSWTELPGKIKERDRQAVRSMPELLARVGLEIRRNRQPSDAPARNWGS
jgi:hypothetical protein